MAKKFSIAAALISVLFFASSCVIRVVDKQPYYTDYDDRAYDQDYSYYNSYYSNAGPIVTAAPTPAPTVAVKVSIVLKVVNNTYVFYKSGAQLAVWVFNNDGTITRRGKEINGTVVRYYEGTNSIESEIPFKKNERWGTCKKYYPNGILKEKIAYSKGKRNGAFIYYHPNGRVMEEGKFKDGNRYGNYKAYLYNGEVVERGVWNSKGKKQTVFVKKGYKPVERGPAVVIPTPTPVKLNKYEGRNVYGDGHAGPAIEGGHSGRAVKGLGNRPNVAITVVVTATPVPKRTVVHGFKQPRVAITVIVTATMAPVFPTAVPTSAPAVLQTEEPATGAEDNNGKDKAKKDKKRNLGQSKKGDKEMTKDEKEELKKDIKGEKGLKDDDADAEGNSENADEDVNEDNEEQAPGRGNINKKNTKTGKAKVKKGK